MQSAAEEAAFLGLPITQSGEKKRKRQSGAHAQDLDPIARQKSIQQLFNTSIKPGSNYRTSPNHKRARQRSEDLSDPGGTLPPSKMYSFPSKHASTSVVDLTESPPQAAEIRQMHAARPLRAGLKSNLGAKKLVVKNLKKQPEWDAEEYFEKTWTTVDASLDKIFAEPDSQTDLMLEDLYRAVERVCRQGKAATVNSRLNDRCCKHLKAKSSSLRGLGSQDDTTILQHILAAWTEWTTQVISIRRIFYFMDRSYLLSHSKTNLNDVCTANFRKIVFEDASLKSKAIEGACELVSKDRRGTEFDRTLLKDAVDMFHVLSVYTSMFEARFLARSQQYISIWVDEAVTSKSLPQYVTDTVALMEREAGRCNDLGLDASTRRDLVTKLQDQAIEARVDFLTNAKAVADLLDSNETLTLEQLYTLLKRRQLGPRMKPAFAKWIESTGTSIIFDEKAEDDMIIRLLSLKRRLDQLWRTSFQRDVDLGHGMREAFETFMNKTKKSESTWGTDNSKTGEMIAKYVDLLLRGGSKAIPTELTAAAAKEGANDDDDDANAVDEDAEVNAQLDQVLDLFRFIHGKAVFEAFYKKDLAKRLLMGRSASADAERSMLTRLKTECGSGFTQNLEQMFKDIELGREEMSGYQSRLEEMRSRPGAIDLNVNVLSAAAWPSYPDVPVTIPSNVHSAIEAFERYYQVKHSGRKLAWKHNLAHCQMKATFPKGTKEFVVSSFQAIVLLLFNSLPEGETLSYEHIKSTSGLPEAEVKRTLQSLACAKLRPLTKSPLGKEINDTDTFSINASFSHPKYRVRINQVQLKETKQENKETHERVAEDRNFECQAAIVRIMKSRKTIGHSELVAEVITATKSRGVLAVADIKRNIDRLIEKDYMEREEGNTYAYVA